MRVRVKLSLSITVGTDSLHFFGFQIGFVKSVLRKMGTSLACMVFVLAQLVNHISTAQRCEKLDAKLFAPCVNIGHTHSSIIPDYVNKTRLSLALKSYAKLTSNCSESSLAMHCAYFFPMCKEGRKEPILPCQRVCADFMRGCGKVLRPDHGIQLSSERYAGMCTILHNEPASSGNCFEPKDFKISPNTGRSQNKNMY